MKNLFLILALSTSLSGFAQTNNNIKETIKTIGPTNIRSITKDKIYLHQDAINIGDHGLYLENGTDDIILLPMVFSDQDGIYLSQTRAIRETFPTCPKCPGKLIGGVCRNKSCSENKKWKAKEEMRKEENKQKRIAYKQSKKDAQTR